MELPLLRPHSTNLTFFAMQFKTTYFSALAVLGLAQQTLAASLTVDRDAGPLQKRGYNLIKQFQSTSDFLSGFSFGTDPDLSGGTVKYVNQSTASSLGMYGTGANGGFR